MRKLEFEYNGKRLQFETEDTLFSPGQIDKGTQAMLLETKLEPGMKVLDIGCGYGVVGICAASVVGVQNVIMTDVNEKAVELSRKNMSLNYLQAEATIEQSLPEADMSNKALEADTVQTVPEAYMEKEVCGDNSKPDAILNSHIFLSNGLNSIDERDFDIILSNPPYHTDFSVAKEFIEDGYKALKPGGRMVMVTKRRTWYENKLKSVFGGVKVIEKDDYFVFVSEKRLRKPVSPQKEKGGMSKKLQKKMMNRKKK